MMGQTRGNLIKFTSDTKYRKQWFTGLHFSHPAKMHLSLQLWLIENFTKESETILDPMAGSGTILVACSMGRNVITVELEDKFVQMQKGNWEKIQQRGCQLGYSMGTATILQGDARNLTGVLADKIITSPPFADTSYHIPNKEYWADREAELAKRLHKTKSPIRLNAENISCPENPSNIGNLPYGNIDKIITSPPYAGVLAREDAEAYMKRRLKTKFNPKTGAHPFKASKESAQRIASDYGDNPSNLGNLPYGSIDAVISSPPYEGSVNVPDSKPEARAERLKKAGYEPKDYQGGTGRNLQQDWSYHPKVDAVISSPPYENNPGTPSLGSVNKDNWGKEGTDIVKRRGLEKGYNQTNEAQIGNLKSDSYLSAMLQVYQQCYQVLKDGGLLVLVVKNFIRNKQQIRLDLDTIKLCEQAGFIYQDRWYRELASQSFWRIIYHQKYPDVEPIKYEDILVFVRGIT